MDAPRSVPVRRSPQGARDHALLLFVFNSGARADEAAHLSIEDLTFGRAPAVKLLGKGNKYRVCPLWPTTLRALEPFTRSRPMEARVFLNRRKEPLTRSGIYKLVQCTAARASSVQPSIKTNRISPHCLRHAGAVHLLRQGVGINTIRGWLGQVSVDTTNIYAEVDLQMKAKALEKCDMPDNAHVKRWHKDPGVIAFLRGLSRRQKCAVHATFVPANGLAATQPAHFWAGHSSPPTGGSLPCRTQQCARPGDPAALRLGGLG